MDSNQNKGRAGNQEENDRDLPGYPHYPADEDIMNPQSGFKKISADEELANSKTLSSRNLNERGEEQDVSRVDDEDDEIKIVSGTEADVTREDLELLGPKDGDNDMSDDELVLASSRVDEVEDEEESELDVPGAELEKDTDAPGQDDEENNYYSLGGDRHENLEEDQAPI